MNNIVYGGFEQGFGDEYPAALTKSGIRWPLAHETRFIRYYHIPEPRLPHQNSEKEISRFIDGSASVTLQQFEAEWAGWTNRDRMDFCRSVDDLRMLAHPELAAMVRFVVHHANSEELSCLAPSMNRIFACNEAFELLQTALHNSRVSPTSNIVQAIALTKHPDAEAAVRRQLQSIWAEASLWDDAPFVNWTAHDALNCIRYLMQLGASPDEFRAFVRKLSTHPCRRIREKCHSCFAEHYSELNVPGDDT